MDDAHDNRSILAIAMDVHMTKTGSFERSDSEQEADIEILRKRTSQWKPTVLEKWARFDAAVKELVLVAIKEPDWRDSYRRTLRALGHEI